MQLDDKGDLAIAELVFWVPGLLLSVLTCFRQGFGRRSGWTFIAVLAVCKIISASCLIAYELESHPSSSIVLAASITGSLGISFLLSALVGIQLRVLQTTSPKQSSKMLVCYLSYVMITVGIILGILGAVKIAGNDPTPDEISLGYKFLKASTILYLVVFILLTGLIVLTVISMKQVIESQRRLVLAIAISMPFVFVRLLYVILAAFDPSSTFDLFDPYIWTEAFMQVLEEFLVGMIIITAGFLTVNPQKDVEW